VNIEKKLEAMGIVLPVPRKSAALLLPVKQMGNTLYVSGQLPFKDGELMYTGKVSGERTVEEGQDAARLCAINALGAVKDYLGDLDKVKNIIKLLIFVNSSEGFIDQPQVGNGASKVFIDVFGEAGRHARSAVGVYQLPRNATVEIEVILEV